MATKLTVALGALLISLAPFAGSALADGGKFGGTSGNAAATGAGASPQETKARLMRSGSSGASIQQSFGGGSGLVLGGGGSGTTDSGSASGPVMGTQDLRESLRRTHRNDGADERPAKRGHRPAGNEVRRGH